jgi:hypothetical protein
MSPSNLGMFVLVLGMRKIILTNVLATWKLAAHFKNGQNLSLLFSDKI